MGAEEGIVAGGARGHHGLNQVLQGCIHTDHAHQHGATAAFLKHLEGDGARSGGGGLTPRRTPTFCR